MARKVVSRKEKRGGSGGCRSCGKGRCQEKNRQKEACQKTASRAKKKTAAEARMRLYWGVFNQSMKRVALYEFNQKRAADKKASELTESSKTPHFVQRVKEMIEE